MIAVPNATSLAALEELASAGNLFDGAIVRLFQNDVTPDRDTVIGDLTAADFTGYADSAAVTWATPFLDSNGDAILPGDLKEFMAGSPVTVSNTIYGYAIVNTGATVLLWAERFDAPVIVSTAGKTIAVMPVFGAASQS
jgi:hypothetical protein